MNYRLGIDIGSKTAKMVILDDKDAVVFSQYSLHRSNVLQTFSELLGNTLWRFGNHTLQVCVTGSAGIRFAEELGLPYVQEVIASRRALQTYLPEVDVAIELGGEDAKILFLRESVEERMNGSCAGGTGGFIDLMCGMLSVRAQEFDALAAAHTHLYPIASRCAVFAQADVRPLINAGARKSDIAASVLQAVVTQTISGLACGRTIEGHVAFLGGPCEVYSELVQRFKSVLNLDHNQVHKPKDAHLFVASGAALIAGETSENSLTLEELKQAVEALSGEQEGSVGRLPRLFKDEEELKAFNERHALGKVPRARLMNYEGNIFIGVDAGSTTLKLAAVNEEGELLFSAYENNKGDVTETMRSVLEEYYRATPREYDGTPLTSIKRAVVCGYGEDLLKAAFRFDSGEVETVAHLRAAQEFCPDASYVLDIGGQDIKCLSLKDGHIDSIMLNEACSSGCGALIQGFARSLGHSKWSFAQEALLAHNPVDLGTRCTVFMTSRVRHAQKEGVEIADISAGLAYSVVRNALYKVMGLGSTAQLGKRVVVQGGTFMNDAVLRAFELESGLEVVRPDIANLMGAYGAALLARDEYKDEARKLEGARNNANESANDRVNDNTSISTNNSTNGSSLLNPYELAALKQQQKMMRCEACGNACNLAVSSFSFVEEAKSSSLDRLFDNTHKNYVWADDSNFEQELFVSGNRCERGALWAAEKLGSRASSTQTRKKKAPNLMRFEQLVLQQPQLASYARTEEQTNVPRLGIPPVLKLYEHYPYWKSLFESLGFEVLPFKQSSAEVYRSGAAEVLSESVCYPAKLMHGHIKRLVDEGANFIFMPSFENKEGHECSVASSYGHLAQHDTTVFSGGKARLLSGCFSGQKPFLPELRALLEQADMSATDEAILHALECAELSLEQHKEALWRKAEQELRQLEQSKSRGIVLLGHPYHSDKGINHGIDELVAELGYTVFSTASLERVARKASQHGPADQASQQDQIDQADKASQHESASVAFQESDELPANKWPQAALLYQVAHFAAKHPQLHLVQLHSFGCGLDALTTKTVREIVQTANKPYTAIKLDEMVDTATLRIRLRSLDYALTSGEEKWGASEAEEETGEVKVLQSSGGNETAYKEPEPNEAMRNEAMSSRSASTAQKAQDLQPISSTDIEAGLAQLDNDLCYQMLAVGGHILSLMQKSNESSSFALPTLCKKCRGAELEKVLNQALDHNVVVSLDAEVTKETIAAFELACANQSRSNANAACSTMQCSNTAPNKVRMGVLGNAAMVLTPEFNDFLLDKMREEGAEPVLPKIEDLFASERPLLDLLPQLYEQGVRDFIFAQSFCCMRSHTDARGMLPEIKQRYPDTNITFLEYDPGVSQVNQISRLKLAVAIAYERQLQYR